MGEGFATIVGGGGDRLLTLSLYLFKVCIAFKYVMATEPYIYNTWYLKQVMAGFPYIKIYFIITLIAMKVKCLTWFEF